MAQRSARARSKLDKITAQSDNGPRLPAFESSNQSSRGLARLGSGGLLTPSASSVSGSSTTRNSRPDTRPPPPQSPPQRVGKGVLRSFFDAHSDKLRGRLAHTNPRKETEVSTSNYYSGLGGGLGPGLMNLRTIGEERIQIRRWDGSGGRGELWDGSGKGKKDLELWFPDGDTLIYLCEKPASLSKSDNSIYSLQYPQPSFRLPSAVLRKSESPLIISMLDQSVSDDGSEISVISVDDNASMEFDYTSEHSKAIEPRKSQSTFSSLDTSEIGIKFRLYLPAPAGLDKISQHRYHLTTRNFFAVLFNRSLVGTSVGQTLLDLSDRFDRYLSSTSTITYELAGRGPTDAGPPYSAMSGSTVQERPDNVQSHPRTQRIILDYIEKREFDDFRGWPEGAAGLLVWAEYASKQNITDPDDEQIDNIWKEAFVHCTGQLASLQLQPEWRDISPITKALIDRASLEIQVRVANADARILGFNFHDMWPVSSTHPPLAQLSFQRFQKFLLKHYATQFGSWPPAEGRLSRNLYNLLQRDFTALYSYLVDWEAVWSPPADTPNAEKRKIVKPNVPYFRADKDLLPITEILTGFDNRENHPPLPHPYPLVPTSPSSRLGNVINISSGGSSKRQQNSFFTKTGAPRNRSSSGASAQAALALSESTNIDALASTISNPLLEAFQIHERSIPVHEINTHDARKGRWILIYGVLQTLAAVAVDAPGVKWTEGVDYWLNPRLRGTPPWKSQNPPVTRESNSSDFELSVDERSHFRSYCWLTARTPHILLPGRIAPRRGNNHSSNSHLRRERSRSKSRNRKPPTKGTGVAEERIAQGEERPSTRLRHNSGDEGDDEMDTAADVADSPSPPPIPKPARIVTEMMDFMMDQ